MRKQFFLSVMPDFYVPKKILVIAQSARMLVQMALDSGYVPFAIDCFGDEDTRQLAADSVKVESLDVCDVQFALEGMQSRYGLTHAVYGSGFEECTDTLVYLEKFWIVLGSKVEVMRAFQEKQAFFMRLSDFSIRYPETVFSAPAGNGWLRKPMRGEGGGGISRHDPKTAAQDGEWYWQRYLHGKVMSVLFLAGQGQCAILGVNRQFTVALDDEHPFVFAGVVNLVELQEENRKQLLKTIRKLTVVYSLQGLCSLDFVLSGDDCYVLEVNSRIPASAQLYGNSVFSWHVQACQGCLNDFVVGQNKGYRVVYAHKALQVLADLEWPEWVVDRPNPGAFINKGKPICSIIAAGKDVEQVENLLRHRQNLVEKLLNIGF